MYVALLLQVQHEVLLFAMNAVNKYFLPLADGACKLASSSTYEELYGRLLANSRQTPEAPFHAKNIANTLEGRLFAESWDNTQEAYANGLGPGFRFMAHIKRGHGKVDGKLARGSLEADLRESTEYIRSMWPWGTQVRQRHIQGLYCECQKFLMTALRGWPHASVARTLQSITRETLLSLAARKTFC